MGGWERWNAEVGEGTAERGGGEGEEEEEGEVHTPYGGLTEAMWDCCWNNKHQDVRGWLEDRKELSGNLLNRSLQQSPTETTTRGDPSFTLLAFNHNIIPVADSEESLREYDPESSFSVV